jgi:hypothetical protein
MVALLLAFLVIWSMILFCGVVIMTVIGLINRLNELSRVTTPSFHQDDEESDTEESTLTENDSLRVIDSD